jgi:hypothetical protein
MHRWPWGLLSGASLMIAGCEKALPRAPIPALDAAAPARTETATFALG